MLEQTIVPLGVEQLLLIKARLLKLVIHIGRDHEIVLIPDQCQKIFIHRLRRWQIPVDIDVPGPESPARLVIREGIEPAGIHVCEAKSLLEIEEPLVKPLPAVDEACRGGKPGAGADHDRIGRFYLFLQPADTILPAARRTIKITLQRAYEVDPFPQDLLIIRLLFI